MAKELCDWKEKDFEKNQDKFLKIVSKPQFYCCKCGRVARDGKWLCKALKFPAGTG
jgi:hypothetical protein